MTEQITLEEWLAAIEAIQREEESQEGVRCRDLAKGLNVGVGKMRRLLCDLIEAGRIEVHHRMVPRMDGLMTRVPVYRLKATEEEERK